MGVTTVIIVCATVDSTGALVGAEVGDIEGAFVVLVIISMDEGSPSSGYPAIDVLKPDSGVRRL